MVSFFGKVCLLIALTSSLVQTLGIVPHNIARLGRPACQTAALFTVAAFLSLFVGFVTCHPDLLVVANNSLSSDPWYIRISGLWNNHVAIMLLWVTLFSMFGSLYVMKSKHRNIDHLSRPVIGINGFIQSGFCLYLVVFMSPFAPVKSPVVLDVSDTAFNLNLHHLLIYASYMLISIVYGLVMGILIEGKRVALLKQEALPWLRYSWGLLVVSTTWVVVKAYMNSEDLGFTRGTVEYESLITLALLTSLFLMLPYVDRSRIVKKLVLLLGILIFFQGLFGSLISQKVSSLTPDVLVTDLQEAKFLFLFIGLGVGLSLMIYMSRVVRSLKKVRQS